MAAIARLAGMTDDHHDRRLAAILAADVVGYSRLMSADERGTFEALRSHLSEEVNPLIEKFGGRVFKTTGDGMLVAFTSAVQAVECAVAIQRVCAERNHDVPPEKRLQFRVGINLGDVIADGDDIFGDGVNVAARLEGVAEPGGISVSQAIYDQVAGKVGVTFTRLGARTLKNIPAPVQVFAVNLDGQAPAAETLPPVIEDRPSIAVLPFENLSHDPGVDILSDGLVEDVITLLARVPGFFVISRVSSFAYRGAVPDLRRVGRELGVRYVVQGSIRVSGERARIVAKLAEAETGRELWSQRFDVARSETLDLQDEIARAIIVELEPELTRAELKVIQRQRPENLDAWSHYRKAVGAIAMHGWNEDSAAEAICELKEAVRLDPNFALAHALLALIIAFGANLSLIDDVEGVREQAQQAAERALELDPESAQVLGFAGCAIADLGKYDRGCEILERAIESDPSNAQARVALGAAEARLKRFDSGIENMRLGIRVSPRDVRLAFWRMILAEALVRANRLEEGLAEATAAARGDGRLYGARVVAATALVRLKRIEEARAALREARRIRPALNLVEIGKFFGEPAAADLKTIWEDA
jgi:adenylate cyclase